MRLQVLQHVAFEDPGHILAWAAGAGHAVTVRRLDLDGAAALPDADRLAGEGDGLVVMGGPMSVHDAGALPWLAAEKRLLEAALARGVPVLGICLGAQLIADVAGAAVTHNPDREVGFFPVRFTPAAHALGMPAELQVLHWHGETFALPRGADRLATSAVCGEQGFAIGGRCIGLQFHMEATPDQLARFAPHLGEEDASLPWVQTPDAIAAAGSRYCAAANAALEVLLRRLFGGRPRT